ncbi:MAG: hypothetical protein SVV03_00385 [Candidatus Nanohaloarchaea archaeon]|nr:hypothetical protein [Candidatus Nanohaloarchaea archaeon]
MGKLERCLYGAGGLALFVLSLQVLGRSTQALTPVLEGFLKLIIRGDLSALGAGWIASYIFMNGSSVAALSLSLFKSGILSLTELFMAVSGSRLGAAFIVVVIGYIQYLQGKNEKIRDSCSIGILSFIVSFMAYIPAIIIGIIALKSYSLGGIDIEGLKILQYSITTVLNPLVSWITSTLTSVPSFILSFAGLFASLKVFDRAFSGISAERFKNKYFRFIMSNSWISFIFGAFTTLITTSVSISVGIIVPLYNRGYIKRKEIVPYLVGANITTLGDTALAAIILGTSTGLKMVLLLAVAVAVPSVLAMVFYNHFFGSVKWLFDRIVSEDRFLAGFALALTALPAILLLV